MEGSNLPDDPELFTPRYYETATPEMVREKLQGKNLSTTSFPRDRLEGMPEFAPLPEPISNHTDNAPIYPLNIALEHSPWRKKPSPAPMKAPTMKPSRHC